MTDFKKRMIFNVIKFSKDYYGNCHLFQQLSLKKKKKNYLRISSGYEEIAFIRLSLPVDRTWEANMWRNNQRDVSPKFCEQFPLQVFVYSQVVVYWVNISGNQTENSF